MKSKAGINVSIVTTGDETDRRRSSVSFAEQTSAIPSIHLTTDFKSDIKIEEFSPSDSMDSASVESFIEPAMHDQLPALPAGIIQPTYPRASFPPLRTHSGPEAV